MGGCIHGSHRGAGRLRFIYVPYLPQFNKNATALPTLVWSKGLNTYPSINWEIIRVVPPTILDSWNVISVSQRKRKSSAIQVTMTAWIKGGRLYRRAATGRGLSSPMLNPFTLALTIDVTGRREMDRCHHRSVSIMDWILCIEYLTKYFGTEILRLFFVYDIYLFYLRITFKRFSLQIWASNCIRWVFSPFHYSFIHAI